MMPGVWRIGMASTLVVGAGLGLGAGVLSRQAAPATTAPDKAAESYSIGFEAGRNLARVLRDDGVDFDRTALFNGLSDGFQGAGSKYSEAEMRRILADLHRRVGEQQARERYKIDPVFRAMADANAARARELVEARAAVPGAQTLKSGVVYRVVRPGEGEPAGDAPQVVVTFHASLPDGVQVAHGVDQEVDTAGLLPGARDLIARLRAGERASAVVPPEAAFGLAGREPEIGPNQAILVEVELISIRK